MPLTISVVYVCACVNCTCTHTEAYTHMHTQIHTHRCTYTHTHAHAHKYVHILTDTDTNTNTYTIFISTHTNVCHVWIDISAPKTCSPLCYLYVYYFSCIWLARVAIASYYIIQKLLYMVFTFNSIVFWVLLEYTYICLLHCNCYTACQCFFSMGWGFIFGYFKEGFLFEEHSLG